MEILKYICNKKSKTKNLRRKKCQKLHTKKYECRHNCHMDIRIKARKVACSTPVSRYTTSTQVWILYVCTNVRKRGVLNCELVQYVTLATSFHVKLKRLNFSLFHKVVSIPRLLVLVHHHLNLNPPRHFLVPPPPPRQMVDHHQPYGPNPHPH